MTDPTPGVPPSSPPAPLADVKPTVLQAIVTLVGGLVLAAGSCAGFLATLNLNRESGVNITFALGFFASLLAAFVGVILIIVRMVKLARRRRELASRQPGRVLAPGEQAGTAAAAVPGTAPGPGVGAANPIDGGPAWKALVVAGALLLAAPVFVALLVAADPHPIAMLFLLLAAASGVGSIVALVIAILRYGRGR
jgi:hypothetical protein